MKQLLRPCEVDRLLSYPPGQAARLARAGKLPAIRLPDGAVRFRPADIESLINATPATKPTGHPQQGGDA